MAEDLEEFRECIREASEERDLEKLGSCQVEVDGINYSADPGMPLFQSNIFEQGGKGNQEKYDMDLEVMDIQEYIESQKARFEKRNLEITPEEAYRRGLDGEKVERMAESMGEGEGFPVPVVEYDLEGNLEMFQEGRHRGEALKRLGKDRVLTWVARRCERRGCGDDRF
jgi:hypothetical protein